MQVCFFWLLGSRTRFQRRSRPESIARWHSDDQKPSDRAIAAAAAVHRASGFDAAFPVGSVGCPDGALGAVSALTEACVSSGGMSDDAEGEWLGVVTEMLLDAWMDLVVQDSSGYVLRYQQPHAQSTVFGAVC